MEDITMKKLIESIVAIAAIFSFAACQKELESPVKETRQTHIVTFVAESPVSKTTADVDKEQGVVNYVWKDTDADPEKFHVFENENPASRITPSLDGEIMSISAEFEGETPSGATYTGYFNSGVLAAQNADGTDYDQLSDVLIAKETTDINDGVIPFQFKRLGAVCEVNLKGLSGSNLKTVKIESLDENVFLAGSLVDGELVGDSKMITVNCDNEIIGGVGTLRFVSMPVENANLRFIVETTDDGEAVAAKYVKALSKPITFTRGDLKAFNVSGFSPVTTTVTFSENKMAGDAILTVEGEDIPFPEVENVDANNLFVGWTKAENYSEESKPTDLCTEAKMGAESVTYYAVYASVSPATTNPDAIVKLDATSTFAAGDNIAVFAKTDDAYYGMYQETVSTSYVNCFKLIQEPVASDFNDAKRSWILSATEVEGTWYLGDATNGYLYNASNNNLTADMSNKSSLTIAWVAEENAFSIKNGNRWIACRTDLSEGNQYKYRGGGTTTISGTVYFDIYKLLKYDGYNTFIDLRETPTLTWSAGSAEARIKAQNTFPKLTTDPAGLPVSYSSSDETVATIDNAGNVTLKKAGETTITATFEGNDQYKGVSASYALTVLPEATKNTVKFSINGVIDDTKTKEYTSGEKITFPNAPEVAGVVFKGWLTNPISGVLDSAPEGLIIDTDNVIMGDADVTYYAVFASIGGYNYSWEEITTVPVEGVYAICTGDYFMKASITSNRFENGAKPQILNGKLTEAPANDCVWEISKPDTYYRIKNGSNYAGGTTSKNQGALLTDASSDLAKWTISSYNSEFSFENYGRSKATSDSGNKFLRNNGSNGWATYASSTGSAPRLFKKTSEPYYSNYSTTVVTLSSVEVSGTPDKVEYKAGDSFEVDGLVATAVYSNNNRVNVTNDVQWTVNPAGALEAGTTSVSVVATYGEVPSSAYPINITVTNVTFNGISIKTAPNKVTYTEGDLFDPAGLVINKNYSDSSVEDVAYSGNEEDFSFSPELNASLKVSDDKVTIFYQGKSVEQAITVNEKPAVSTMDDIFTAANAAGSTATDIKVNFTDCVVTGVKGSNAYLTDANGTKGLIIYATDHGFNVGDKLNGKVDCYVQLYNGASELTGLKSTTTGLTVTKDGTVTPQTISIANLSGINTGAVISFSKLSYDGANFTDGTNSIQPYGAFMTLPTFDKAKKYNITGVFIQYKTTKEIAPRTEADIEEIEVPYINAAPAKSIAAAAGETISVTVETNVASWTVESSDPTNFAISGKTTNSFNVVVAENTDTQNDREATITVKAEGAEDAVFTLKQVKKGGSTGPAVGTVLWGENFAHFGTKTPSAAGTGTGTTIYGDATITYDQSSTNTKGYNEKTAGGTAPELLLSKSNQTWTISGIPCADVTNMSLTFLSNKTAFAVSSTTTGITVTGSQKSWTIKNSGATTFTLVIKNTSSKDNARIDNVELKVTAN